MLSAPYAAAPTAPAAAATSSGRTFEYEASAKQAAAPIPASVMMCSSLTPGVGTVGSGARVTPNWVAMLMAAPTPVISPALMNTTSSILPAAVT